jgi:hypothetical protein
MLEQVILKIQVEFEQKDLESDGRRAVHGMIVMDMKMLINAHGHLDPARKKNDTLLLEPFQMNFQIF